MGGIGVVVNPRARANRRGADEIARRIATVVGADGLVRVTASLEALAEVAGEFHAHDIDILALCGGDGTFHCALTAFHAAYGSQPLPPLLPLRAGTINYIADATGGRRGRPEQVVARVLRDHRRGRTHVTTERDLLRINGQELGFVLGFGTVVNYLRAYYALDRQGPRAAAGLLFRLIASAMLGTHMARAVVQPIDADVTVDGEPLPFRQFRLFLAATVDRIALGFRPTYLGTRKRGHFHVVAGPAGARDLIPRIVRFYRGFPSGLPMLYDNLGRTMTIQFFRPTHFMLDGDILPPVERLDVDVPLRVTLIRS